MALKKPQIVCSFITIVVPLQAIMKKIIIIAAIVVSTLVVEPLEGVFI